MSPKERQIIAVTSKWVSSVVIGLNLCPFAGRVFVEEMTRLVVSDATTKSGLLLDLKTEIDHLDTHPETETTLLIHPQILEDFYDYNDFLDQADRLLEELDRVGVYQVASFHPNYLFAGTEPGDAENYTNRSPYPMLHLLREESVSKAVAAHPNPESIPDRNVALLKKEGKTRMQALRQASFDLPDAS